MNWYYAQGDNKIGPVDEAEFKAAVDDGRITDETLVWRDGMTDWVPHARLSEQSIDGVAIAGQGQANCNECGQPFSTDEMIEYQSRWICAACKPQFLQKIKEGVELTGDYQYGGFWIRFAAKIVDTIITTIVNYGFTFAMLGISMGITAATDADEALVGITMLVSTLIGILIPAAYESFFLGRYGATPGKMLCGLEVICLDGSRPSYLRAFGRIMLQTCTAGNFFGIGYIIAAFDDEKRALHDWVCSTRVIRKRT